MTNDNNCVFCLGNILEDNNNITTLSCGCPHIYHTECFIKSYYHHKNRTCPLCRKKITNNDIYMSDNIDVQDYINSFNDIKSINNNISRSSKYTRYRRPPRDNNTDTQNEVLPNNVFKDKSLFIHVVGIITAAVCYVGIIFSH